MFPKFQGSKVVCNEQDIVFPSSRLPGKCESSLRQKLFSIKMNQFCREGGKTGRQKHLHPKQPWNPGTLEPWNLQNKTAAQCAAAG
jgi:hypothetical protein